MLQTLVSNEKYFMLWTLSVNFDKIFFGTEKLSISNFTFICLVMVMCRKNIFCYWNDVEIIHLIFVSVIVKLQVWSKVQVNGWFCVYCVFKTGLGLLYNRWTNEQMDEWTLVAVESLLRLKMKLSLCDVNVHMELFLTRWRCGEPRKPCCESTAHYGSSYLVQWSKWLVGCWSISKQQSLN